MADATNVINGWERALLAAEKVKERLRRATQALDEAGVPYAVAGGNAVAEGVGRVDEGAVRNTRDVDLLIHRADFAMARQALEAVRFQYDPREYADTFIDGPQGRLGSEIRIIFAGEVVSPDVACYAPKLDESEAGVECRVTSLDALVRLELIFYRIKHRMHLRDLIDVGLLDATWPARFPPPLTARLQELLDDPEG